MGGNNDDTVAAVVVTHNRKELLRQCLRAIQSQTRAPNEILVVDNASTDGTAKILAAEFPGVNHLRLPQNTGGAGGFYAGIKAVYSRGYDWLWLMDDDTIAEPGALAELFAAYRRFNAEQRPRLLASKVIWTDGTLHPMNIPTVKTSHPEKLLLSVARSTLSIRSTSFVSLLLHKSLVKHFGLPIAGYFIWNDDVEYTARILRKEFGVLVPSSVVYHKTAQKYTPIHDTGSRFYYEVRNKIWMLTRSRAWSKTEKFKIGVSFLKSCWRFLVQSRFRLKSIYTLLRGFGAGIFTRPGT